MFGLNGLGGYLIAVALLLTIVGVLGSQALFTQQKTATQPYGIKSMSTGEKAETLEDVFKNLHELKMIDPNSRKVQISES